MGLFGIGSRAERRKQKVNRRKQLQEEDDRQYRQQEDHREKVKAKQRELNPKKEVVKQPVAPPSSNESGLSRKEKRLRRKQERERAQLEKEKSGEPKITTGKKAPHENSKKVQVTRQPVSSQQGKQQPTSSKRQADIANTSKIETVATQLSAKTRSGTRKRFREEGDDLLESFKAKLNGSTFRLLNEELYNSPNSFVAQMLRDKKTFEDYHAGYRVQMAQWPVAPTQIIVDALLKDKRGRFLQNKEKHIPGCIVKKGFVMADMGCGDAAIAKALKDKEGVAVHSYDLCANNELVTACDMAHVPLSSAQADVVVFCLSLMATDYFNYILEAHRLLKAGKLLKIVEVRSRLPRPEQFAELVEGVGFKCDWWGVVTNYFVAYDFVKLDQQIEVHPVHLPSDVLHPCVYKRR